MSNPFVPIVILLCLSMFFIKREYKIAVLYISMTILFSVPNSFPGGKFFTLPMFFLLSEIPNYKEIYHSLKKGGVLTMLIVMFIATIILAINSPHYNSFLGFGKLFLREMISKYFFIAYAFICIYNYNKTTILLKVAYYSIIIITILGIHNLITHHSYFLDIAMQGGKWNDILAEMGGKYEHSSRFRVQSTFYNAFCYGYICIINLMMFVYAYTKRLVSKRRYHVVIACSLFGVIFCGSRTVLIVAIVTYLSYILLGKNLSKKITYLAVFSIFFVVSYGVIDPIRERIDKTIGVFEKNNQSDDYGSSLEMREAQYLAVFHYTRNNLLFGRGAGFFREDLGYKDGHSGLVDRSLRGLEGVFLSRMLERGIVGVLFYMSFNILVFISIWKWRHEDRISYALATSLLIGYLIFAIMTGELESFPPTFLIIGIILSILYHQKKKKLLSKNVLNSQLHG